VKIIENLKNYIFIITISVIIFFILLILSEITVRKYFIQYLPVGNMDWKIIMPSSEDMRKAFIENGDDWVDEFINDTNTIDDAPLKYSPFKIYRFSGNINSKYINVINGERIPYIVNNSNCINFREINIYGGSAVHGDGWLRDQDLLNHQIGKLLELNGYDCFKFYNRGQSGYNSKQNFIKFFEMDKSENSIHIFYDGVNDFMHNIFNNQSHLNQDQYESSFNMLFGLSSYKEQFINFSRATIKRFKFVQLISGANDKNLPNKWNISKANELCEKWSDRSNAIYNENKINNSNSYFIWQITIDNLLYLKEIEKEIKNKTIKHLGNIFKSYEKFRDVCVENFNKKGLKLHKLANLPNKNKVLFFDYVHLNPPGNRILASYIFNIIEENF
jgi:hypothetical protein